MKILSNHIMSITTLPPCPAKTFHGRAHGAGTECLVKTGAQNRFHVRRGEQKKILGGEGSLLIPILKSVDIVPQTTI